MARLQKRAALLGLVLGAHQSWAAISECAGAGCASDAEYPQHQEDTSLLQMKGSGIAKEQGSKMTLTAKEDKCEDQCQGLPDPEEPGSNTAFGLAKIAVGVMNEVLSGVAGTAVKAGAALLDGTQGMDSEWAVYELQKSLVTMQDYLVCEMKKVVGSYFAAYMDSQQLDGYNTGMQTVQHMWFDKCSDRACLNVTDMAGDLRNGVRPGCCDSVPTDSRKCMTAKQSDIDSGRAFCTYSTSSYTGVCGTDRKCWGCIGREQIIQYTWNVIEKYKSKDSLEGGAVLDAYNNVDAIIAYAKGTTFILSLYQTLVFLGAAGTPNDQSISFTNRSVAWLEKKIDALRDVEARREVVLSASGFSDISHSQEDYETVYVDGCRRDDYPSSSFPCQRYVPATLPGYKVRYGCDEKSSVRFVRLGADDEEACAGCLNSDDSKNTKRDANACQYTGYDDADYHGESQTWTGNVNYMKENDMNDKTSSVKLGDQCDGVQFFDHADYRENGCSGKKGCEGYPSEYGTWIMKSTGWVGELSNDCFSSAKVWTEGTVTNTETGCVCQALQPLNAPEGQFYPGEGSWNPYPWRCSAQLFSDHKYYVDDNCKGWSKSNGGFTGYKRKVPSFDEAVQEGMERLDDFYAKELKEVIGLVDQLNRYIPTGVVPALHGVWIDSYTPSPQCPVAGKPVGS